MPEAAKSRRGAGESGSAALFSVSVDRFAVAAAPSIETVETMKNRQLLSNFLGRAYCLSVVALLAACSGTSDEAGPEDGNGGSAGSSGSTNVSGTNNSGGSNGSAGSNGSSGSPSGGPQEVVGSFQVQVVADDEDPTSGGTSVIGKVSDGPSPSAVIWTVTTEDGDCHVAVPSVPFCSEGCPSEVCVADDVCQAYPTGHAVGEVTLSGVNLAGGGSEIVLKEVAKAYQPPAGTSFAYPPFAEGDAIALQASGGDYSAFELGATGVAPITLSSTDFELDEGKALELTWNAAADPKASQVHIKLDISHHGGARGMIECDTDDSGAITISAELITELIGLGVAGFPSVILTRTVKDSAQIEVGLVELVISSKVERLVTVAGVESCTEDADCPDGGTCQADLTCM
jgi:hypothetical protein